MRLLLDENVPGTLAPLLRQAGHDVLSIRETMPGAGDEAVLARAQADVRIVVTHDKDFGELAFRVGLPAHCGIILFRLSGASPESDRHRILSVLASQIVWAGHFAVVTDDRVRVRPIPGLTPGG